LVWKCAELAAELGCSVALVGAEPGVAERAASRMQERFPGAAVYAIPTPFELDELAVASMNRQIKTVNAKIVLAALGAPKQERWLKQNMRACGAVVGIGCGSALDIIAGDKPRAPQWMQNNGLEWFHRMLQEPRRLGKRYLVEDSPFVVHLLAEVARQRLLG
jgi:N-acetylglucosaminyldiphosphoundecaprenol N-acetyl-beta-D-mannosaminyltransferase